MAISGYIQKNMKKHEKAHQAAKSCDDFTRNCSSFTIGICIANTALILQYLNK
jgi:N-acetyl-anhydromuramyl-L-alanine amidase AmpD